MRRRAAIAALGGAVALVPVVSAPTPAAGCGSTGGTGLRSTCGGGKYVNPFKGHRWYAGRIDMGVDYMPKRRSPVRAIGKAKILGADRNSGWPGGHYMWYKLLRGDHRGDIIYVAETIKHMKHKGARVRAGERIATALPHGTGIEIGWAQRDGQPRAARCYSEGMRTHSGKEMSRFLQELGAPVQDKLSSSVSDEPSGKRC